MTAKEGIAYMGDNKGKVNAKGTTTAVNYGAIIGYVRNQGKVEILGQVEAIDKNTTSEANKYKNIAALQNQAGKLMLEEK